LTDREFGATGPRSRNAKGVPDGADLTQEGSAVLVLRTSLPKKQPRKRREGIDNGVYLTWTSAM
jgi:hypothetical protein